MGGGEISKIGVIWPNVTSYRIKFHKPVKMSIFAGLYITGGL